MKECSLLFLTSGLGDNLLTLPLALELEERTALTIVARQGPQADFFAACLPNARLVKCDTSLSSLWKIASAGWSCASWIYPIGVCDRRFRLLHLAVPGARGIGFTPLVSQKVWQGSLGFEYCATPDLAKRAWKNNLRLLRYLGIEPSLNWEGYIARLSNRLPARSKENGLLIIHAGSARYPGELERYKRWPLERYEAVADRLLSEGTFDRISWILGPDDADLTNALTEFLVRSPHRKHMNIVSHLSFDNDLLRLGEWMASADYLLSNDSGLAHLATLYSVPLTALQSGLGQPTYTSQNGAHSQILVEPTECYGCAVGISQAEAKAFQCLHEWACMDRFTVEFVSSKVRSHAFHYRETVKV